MAQFTKLHASPQSSHGLLLKKTTHCPLLAFVVLPVTKEETRESSPEPVQTDSRVVAEAPPTETKILELLEVISVPCSFSG